MQLSKAAIGFSTFFWVCGFTLVSDSQPIETAGPAGISDNSFLIEEAYNQEKRVVQHISNVIYSPAPRRDWTYAFTQEWPVSGQSHQLSYTLLYQWLDDGRVRGVGDIMINYRYQWLADGDWAWISPRLSLILPTGDDRQGLGNGSPGFQAALPLSRELSGSFVVHGNAGCTAVFGDGNPVSYFLGGSLIWRTSQTLNFMLESVDLSDAGTGADGGRETEFILNPGLRFAVNRARLQIVPGIAIPISFKKDRTAAGLFVYLSFEHPY
jgi:hypothetical protein